MSYITQREEYILSLLLEQPKFCLSRSNAERLLVAHQATHAPRFPPAVQSPLETLKTAADDYNRARGAILLDIYFVVRQVDFSEKMQQLLRGNDNTWMLHYLPNLRMPSARMPLFRKGTRIPSLYDVVEGSMALRDFMLEAHEVEAYFWFCAAAETLGCKASALWDFLRYTAPEGLKTLRNTGCPDWANFGSYHRNIAYEAHGYARIVYWERGSLYLCCNFFNSVPHLFRAKKTWEVDISGRPNRFPSEGASKFAVTRLTKERHLYVSWRAVTQ